VAIPDSSLRKSELRKQMRRAPLPTPADSAAVCEALDRWLTERPELQTLAVYAALAGEVDLAAAVRRHSNRCWVYPKVVGPLLSFHAVSDPGLELLPGAFGILEPSDQTPTVPVQAIDAFFCPGLAFDLNGGRLGRGRGFYDRMLAHARPGSLKIGIGFPYQRVADTLAEPHDIRMDGLIGIEPS
jgi:5-formyltetrahydrofolate cyclo-ligase